MIYLKTLLCGAFSVMYIVECRLLVAAEPDSLELGNNNRQAENQELRAFMMEQSKEYSRFLSEQRKETCEIMNKVIELSKPGNMTMSKLKKCVKILYDFK